MSSASILWLDSCGSTSAELRLRPDARHGLTVAAREQTAGRGQRGNSWEAEPGANLTFSMLLEPRQIEAARQFELSMLIALAVAEFLDGLGIPDVQVKWPNDIYAGDRKICGILIENTLSGKSLARSIAGIGININQHAFRSDAPNPVSLTQLTGRSYDLEPLLADVAERILTAVEGYDPADSPALLARYRSRLWHGTGLHRYHEPAGPTFTAAVVDVSPAGYLTLSNGRTYAFKEVVQEL